MTFLYALSFTLSFTSGFAFSTKNPLLFLGIPFKRKHFYDLLPICFQKFFHNAMCNAVRYCLTNSIVKCHATLFILVNAMNEKAIFP